MSTFTSVVPTGTVNGINPLFTLGTGTAEVYVNGALSADYTLTTSTTTGTATATLTFTPTATPQSGDTVVAWLFNQ